MSLTIVKHPRAADDVLDAYVYLAERNPDAARRLVAAIDADLHKLADLPGLGVACRFANPKLAGIRRKVVAGFRNYLIFYRETPNAVEFLRMPHGARDLERVLSD